MNGSESEVGRVGVHVNCVKVFWLTSNIKRTGYSWKLANKMKGKEIHRSYNNLMTTKTQPLSTPPHLEHIPTLKFHLSKRSSSGEEREQPV